MSQRQRARLRPQHSIRRWRQLHIAASDKLFDTPTHKSRPPRRKPPWRRGAPSPPAPPKRREAITTHAQADGGDLLGLLSGLYKPSEIRPDGYPDAVIWQGGSFSGDAKPVAHALTDAYAMIGTIAAADVLGLPFYMVPMWAHYRHDLDLAPLSWFGNMPCTSIKWSTAGDAYVNDGKGGRVVVKGKSGNAPLRTQAGVFCNLVG